MLSKNEKMRYGNCRVNHETKAKSVWQSIQNMIEIQCPQRYNRKTIKDTWVGQKWDKFHLENKGGMCDSLYYLRVMYDLKWNKEEHSLETGVTIIQN